MTFHILHLKNYPIYDQLQLEETLLRTSNDNWLIINEGSTPAIVMGISGKKEELVCPQNPFPLIKRFSGGGTVIVDENTLFATFICNKSLHDFPAYPEPIMRWTESIYQKVFNHPEFALRENDYVIGPHKCGGNAQYIKKDRWLHHTSFLWDYSPHLMQYLLHPKKAPPYRQNRTHTDFLCKLKDHFPCKTTFIQNIQSTLNKPFSLHPITLTETLKQYPLVSSSTQFISCCF